VAEYAGAPAEVSLSEILVAVTSFDPSADTRTLQRALRSGSFGDGTLMPESVAWQLYRELNRRGEEGAAALFMGALRRLHQRRVMGVADLSVNDPWLDDHRQVEDAYLGEMWKAYKKCIRDGRPGPASHLLGDLEERLGL
jgi:hypothetical protein